MHRMKRKRNGEIVSIDFLIFPLILFQTTECIYMEIGIRNLHGSVGGS
jgi:hypothetical protein